MSANVQQFVPSAVCLTCDGCCRFKEEESLWRPHMAPEEIKHAARQGLAEGIFLPALSGDGRIKTHCFRDEHCCSFFNPSDHTCRVYHARPFECRLYPFVLHKRDHRIMVCVHLNCPYIQATEADSQFQGYVNYLKEYFTRQEVQEFLKRNPAVANDYSLYQNELKELFEIHFV